MRETGHLGLNAPQILIILSGVIMRYYSLLLVLLVFNTSLFSYKNINIYNDFDIDDEITHFFSDGQRFHAFTKEIDVNGDGIYDEGTDQKAEWLLITKSGGVFDKSVNLEFDFGLIKEGMRVKVDEEEHTAYLASDGNILKFDLLQFSIEEILTGYDVEVNEENIFILNEDEDIEGGIIEIYNKTDLTKIEELSSWGDDYLGLTKASFETETGNTQLVVLFDNQVSIIDYKDGADSIVSFEFEAQLKDAHFVNGSLYIIPEESEFSGTHGQVLRMIDFGELPVRYNTGINSELDGVTGIGEDVVFYNTSYIGLHFQNNLQSLEINENEFQKKTRIFDLGDDDFIIVNFTDGAFSEAELRDATEDFLFEYLTVGKQPVKSYYDVNKGILHVFCLGEDSNFNGEFDDGDEAPSWWIVTNIQDNLEAQKVRDFDFASLRFPFRPAIDEENDLLYIAHNDRVAQYDLLDYSVLNDNLWTGTPVSVTIAGPHLLITVAGNFDETGEIIVYDKFNGNVLQSIETGINPQKSLYFSHNGQIWFAILNNGSYDTNESNLQYAVLPHMQQPELKEVNVGLTANDIEYINGKIYIVANGSHEILELDLETDELSSLNLGTNGFDGPRSINSFRYEDDENEFDVITVANYSGNISAIFPENLSNAGLLPVDLDIRIEDFEIINEEEEIYAISAPFDRFYSPLDEIILTGRFITSVYDFHNKSITQAKIYPVPANDFVTIDLIGEEINHYSFDLIDMNGIIVGSDFGNGSKIQININKYQLSNGIYFVKIKSNDETIVVRFDVSK